MGSEFVARKSSLWTKKSDTKPSLFASRPFSVQTREDNTVNKKELPSEIPPANYITDNIGLNAPQPTVQRQEDNSDKEQEPDLMSKSDSPVADEEEKISPQLEDENKQENVNLKPAVDEGDEEIISPQLEDENKKEDLQLAADKPEKEDSQLDLKSNEAIQAKCSDCEGEAQQKSESIQTKLTVGEPGDKYEQEADTVAAKVVEQINSPKSQQPVQGKVEPVVQPTLMRQGGAGSGTVNRDVEQNIQQARGGGQGLADNVRQPMEQAFGADFSGVKVHTGGQADVLNRSLNSRAFATGQDIFFKQGEYNPGSRGGQELLAHELTHVVQQKKSSLSKIQQRGTEVNPDEIPDSHILLEYVAHHVVYNHGALQDPERSAILTRAGYDIENVVWRTGRYGFQACLILPLPTHQRSVAPILAIRGTDTLAGHSTNLDFAQVGSNQFSANREQILELLDLAGRSVDLTGHSLGGAVAQIIAANFPGQVRNLVTFQSPGINLFTLSQFNRLQESERPEHITHHIASRDLVDLAGIGRLPGPVYQHEQQSRNPYNAHTAFLFGTDTFRRRRERLGLSDHFMEREVGKNIRHGNLGITRYPRYPYQVKRFFASVGRSGLSVISSPLTVPYDVFSSQRPDQSGAPIASPHAMEKIRRILDRLEGWTSATDMREILDILSTVESRSEMSEIYRVIEPILARYLVDIDDIIRIRLAFERLL